MNPWMAFKRKYRSRPWKKSRRGRFSRKKRQTFQSRVNRVLMKKAETKFFDIGVQDLQLYHNLGWGTSLIPPTTVTSIPTWFNSWINILQGTSRFNRIGDEITPRGMSIKMFIANKYDRPNCQVRIIVAVLPKLVNGIITTASFDPFQPPNQGTCGNTNLLHADHDKGVKFLYDKIHHITPNMAEQVNTVKFVEKTATFKLWIKRKKSSKIKYDTTSTTIVNKPIAIYVIPYEQYSTITTDIVMSMTGIMRMYYKDI